MDDETRRRLGKICRFVPNLPGPPPRRFGQVFEIQSNLDWPGACIALGGYLCRPRSALSQHLTVSYVPSPTASVSAPVSAAAPATDSPLGFLAALVDQLVGRTSPQVSPQVVDLGASTGNSQSSDTDLLALLKTGTDSASETGAIPPQTVRLLTDLTEALSALGDAVQSGRPADPELVQQVNDAVDALAGQLGIALTGPVPGAGPDDAPDLPVTTKFGAAQTAPALALAPTDDRPPQQDKPALPGIEQVAEALALLLGIAPTSLTQPTPDSPAANAPAAIVSAQTPAHMVPDQPPLPAIAALAAKLAEIGKAVAAQSPELAQKLAALGTTLAAAEAKPDLLAALATDSGKLDQLVKQLLEAPRPTPAAPQLAAVQALKTPAGLVAPAGEPVAAATPKAIPLEANAAGLSAKLGVGARPSDAAQAAPRMPGGKEPAAEAPRLGAATTDPAPTQPVQGSAASPQAVPAIRAAQIAYQPPAGQAATVPQFAFEMVRQFQQGQSRFTIRLDPPELGRVEVKMHVDAAGNVNARLTVERAETLDMFQRDQRSLERALAQAGLEGSKTNLEFNLRQNPFNMSGQSGQGDRGFFGNFGATPAAASDETSIPSVILYRGAASPGGVNLFV